MEKHVRLLRSKRGVVRGEGKTLLGGREAEAETKARNENRKVLGGNRKTEVEKGRRIVSSRIYCITKGKGKNAR